MYHCIPTRIMYQVLYPDYVPGPIPVYVPGPIPVFMKFQVQKHRFFMKFQVQKKHRVLPHFGKNHRVLTTFLVKPTVFLTTFLVKPTVFWLPFWWNHRVLTTFLVKPPCFDHFLVKNTVFDHFWQKTTVFYLCRGGSSPAPLLARWCVFGPKSVKNGVFSLKGGKIRFWTRMRNVRIFYLSFSNFAIFNENGRFWCFLTKMTDFGVFWWKRCGHGWRYCKTPFEMAKPALRAGFADFADFFSTKPPKRPEPYWF